MNSESPLPRLFLASVLLAGLLISGEQTLVAQDAPVVPPRKGPSANIRLFNGEDLTGWIGHEKYWSVEDGEIVGRNTEPVAVSTYLLTEADFSDFRLTLEFKLVQSEMPSGIALWGQMNPDKGDPFAYAGHLVAFPSDYGIQDLYGREELHDNADKAKPVGKQHDWNRIEILTQGNRIRIVLNGELVSDWREPEPDRIQPAPIGLQLHSNEEPQEVRFRNLRLETFPEDRLITLSAERQIEVASGGTPARNVEPGTPDLWTQHEKVVIPDELLAPIRHPKFGLKHFGIRAEERDSFYAILQKAREQDLSTLKKAAREFQAKRQQEGLDGKYADRPASEFPAFVDLFKEPDVYHGKLVTLRGHIRKLIHIPAGENPYGIDGYWEGWLYDTHGQSHPAVVLGTALDEGLTEGTEFVVDHISVTGYFFKNYGFEGQDAMRFAPLFIAQKIEYHPPAPALNPFDLGLSAKMQLLIAAVVILMAGRFALRVWKKSQAEERKRKAVREIVSTDEEEPTFDNIVDNGGMPQFPQD